MGKKLAKIVSSRRALEKQQAIEMSLATKHLQASGIYVSRHWGLEKLLGLVRVLDGAYAKAPQPLWNTSMRDYERPPARTFVYAFLRWEAYYYHDGGLVGISLLGEA